MPDPPPANPITVYLFENPVPLVGVLLLAAAVTGISALRAGVPRRLGAAGFMIVIGLVALLVERIVTTSGEQAEAVTRGFVEAVTARDVSGAMSHLSDDATLGVGNPNNPGRDYQAILRNVDAFARTYDVDNRITGLDAYSVEADLGLVHLSCSTSGQLGRVATGWEIRVGLDDDGSWRIDRLTWLTMGGQPVSGDLLPR